MKRYTLDAFDRVEDNHGDYVEFEEAQGELAARDRRIGELEETIVYLEQQNEKVRERKREYVVIVDEERAKNAKLRAALDAAADALQEISKERNANGLICCTLTHAHASQALRACWAALGKWP